jgi:hypothetical protein
MITYFVLWCYLLIQGMAQTHRSSAFSKRRGVTLMIFYLCYFSYYNMVAKFYCQDYVFYAHV